MTIKILKWYPEDVAKTFAEGSQVLIKRTDRKPRDDRYLSVCGWFRPDWVGISVADERYYYGKNSLYMLIEHPNGQTV